jgi:hypothetical protein
MICNGIIDQSTEVMINTLNSLCRKEITKGIAAKTLHISEEEVNALMEGFYWNPIPDFMETNTEKQAYDKPELFEEIFEEYIEITDIKRLSNKRIDTILIIMEDLASVFPAELFPELYVIYYQWDEATRYAITHISGSYRVDVIKQLRDTFWKLYNMKMETIRVLIEMQSHFSDAVIETDKRLSELKTEIMSKCDDTCHHNALRALAHSREEIN